MFSFVCWFEGAVARMGKAERQKFKSNEEMEGAIFQEAGTDL